MFQHSVYTKADPDDLCSQTHWRDYLEGCFPEWVACFALLIVRCIKSFEIPTVIET